MSGLLAVCPACGETHEENAALKDALTAAAKRENGLKAKLHAEMKTGPLMKEIAEVFEHWLVVFRPNSKRKPKLDAKRISIIRARLRDDWTVTDLNRSLDGWETDDWTMGREKRTKGATRLSMIERLLADSGSVEHGLSLADTKDAGQPSPKPITPYQPRPADPGSGVRRVLSALEARDLRIVPRPGGFEAQCPGHHDRSPSLGIDQGDEGALLCCQAGCTVDEICRALHLDVAALFDTWRDPLDRPLPQVMRRTNGRMPDQPVILPLPSETDLEAWHAALLTNEQALAVLYERKRWTVGSLGRYGIGLHKKRLIFPVRDSAGELLTVARYSPSPLEGDPKMLGLAGYGRHPFPAPESYDPGTGLWLVEGEPDVLSAHELGVPAVAVPGVEWAKGPKLNGFADRFAGRAVVVCMDCDVPGRAAANRVRAAFVAADIAVRVVDLDSDRTDGFDVGDVLKEHGPDGGGWLRSLGASGGTARLQIGDAA